MEKNFKDTVVGKIEFHRLLGTYYGAWTAADLTIDFAIGKFLKITHENAQILTAGMMFGSKIRLLIELVNRSDDKNRSAIIGALRRLQSEPKRDILAHSYLLTKDGKATFIERPRGGEYYTKLHSYSMEEWRDHVKNFGDIGTDLWKALGSPQDELEAFAEAAIKSAKS